ncbi:MAG: YdcH family protein [Chromatiales bacterium]|nr:YdcH family protein [Chromatiales bacterium]
MFAEHHDLLHEFPEHRERIHALKTQDAHFAKLFDEYHALDRELRRVQQEIETPSDEVVEDLKKQRLHLKDQLYARITAA